MDSIAKSDFFFVTTTIVVVVVAILVVIALVYVIRFLRDVNHVSQKVREESDELIKDVGHLRTVVKKEVTGLGSAGTFISRFFKRKKKHGTK